jgi:hypothetical protein
MDYEVSPHGSGVEQQQPIPRDHTKVLNSGGDLANISAGPAALEAVCEMSGDEWTGTLYLNGVCAQARARATEAVRNPYAHSFRETFISLTSTQKAISVAKSFAT